MIIIPIIAFFILVFGYFLYKHYSQEFMRKRAIKKHSSKKGTWKTYLQSEAKLFNILSNDEQHKLLDAILIFYSEKIWANELEDKQRLLTAYYACLPIFKRKTNYYPNIKRINIFMPFDKWLEQNEKQFEIDFGKLALKEMGGKFTQYSLSYFDTHEELIRQRPKVYKSLNQFYRLRT